jgi:CubicO group peptidase (beta-lactamase class C family)
MGVSTPWLSRNTYAPLTSDYGAFMPRAHALPLSRHLLVAIAAILPMSLGAADGPTPIQVLTPFIERHALAGAVAAIISRDHLLNLDAIGSADIAAGKPMAPDTLFWIASMSKPMTATALMMLVDEGKVHLDDPVEKYLPEFRGQMLVAHQEDGQVTLKKPAHPITVRNILSHTSGLPFSSRVENQGGYKADLFPLSTAIIAYALTPLKTEPDSKYEYCNAGINTAGRIIEVVSGMPYETFMAERLFKPLGMTDTTLWPNEAQVGRLAKSYRPNAAKDGLDEIHVDQLTYPLSDLRRGVSPAGGYFSTAGDIARFGRMILCGGAVDGHRYLSEASVREMTSTQAGDRLNDPSRGNGYGLGWSTQAKSVDGGPPAPAAGCGHGGAYNTNLSIDPVHGVALVFMVQHNGWAQGGDKARSTYEKAAIDAFAAK